MRNKIISPLLTTLKLKLFRSFENLDGFSSYHEEKKFLSVKQGFQKLFVSILLIFLFLIQLSAQPASQVPTWTYDTLVNGVEFYHAISDCDGKKVVFLKLNNKNNNKVEISWKEVFTTQNGAEIPGYSGMKNIVVAPGETKETNCHVPVQKQLVILPAQVDPTYLADISKFDYRMITTAKVN